MTKLWILAHMYDTSRYTANTKKYSGIFVSPSSSSPDCLPTFHFSVSLSFFPRLSLSVSAFFILCISLLSSLDCLPIFLHISQSFFHSSLHPSPFLSLLFLIFLCLPLPRLLIVSPPFHFQSLRLSFPSLIPLPLFPSFCVSLFLVS